MDGLINPQLISLIACPDCHGNLGFIANQLRCNNCENNYEIRDGIPCLYPLSIDMEHLREEESLANMMKRVPSSRKDQFSLMQWDKSKREFWEMVSENIQGAPTHFVNLGCGYDTSFVDFEKEGHIFINFDLVYKMLHSLQEEHRAKFCVAGDINSLPFKLASFDYVISIDVIHHENKNLESLIKSFAYLLKPGGTLFLEDPNAWGIFQAPKSILLPKPLHRLMRNMYHKLKRSSHRPADYEFPTSVWRLKRILKSLGFTDIIVYPNSAYPCIGPRYYQLYSLFSGIVYIRKYHNYHYMISARKQ